LVLQAGLAFGTDFGVLDVEGRVWSRKIYGDGWRPLVKGSRLEHGEIVKVAGRSRIVIGVKEIKAIGYRGAEGSIAISRPIMFRVSDELIRTLEIETQNFGPLDVEGIQEDKLWGFENMAKRVVGYIIGDRIPEGGSSHVAVNAKIKALRIVIPLANEYFYAPRFPFNVQVVWQRAYNGAKYNVFLQSMDSGKEEFYAKADTESFIVTVPTNGKYRVRVETDDKKYQSEAVQFAVSSQSTIQKVAFADGETGGEYSGITLLQPKDGTLFLSKEAQETIYFKWSFERKSAGQGDEAFVRVYQPNGSTYGTAAGTNGSASLPLPPGEYLWQVIQKAEGFETPLRTSAKNRLQIRKPTNMAQLAAEYLKEGDEDTSIYVLP
jgi:hypothetical protein